MGLNEKTIALKLKVVQASETKKSLDSLKKVATNWDKVFGPNGDKPVKNQKRQIDLLKRSWDDLGRAMRVAKENFAGGFSAGSQSMQGISNFTRGVEGLTKKVFNLKSAFAATAVGAGVIFLGHKLFEEGGQAIRTRKRLAREFGDEATDIKFRANNIAFGAGITRDDAAKGLIPLAEQLQAIEGGAQFRGMKKPLTNAQATALRAKNLGTGSKLLKRLSTLAPDVETDELGRILGDALSGPEGIRSLVSTLHLSKRSKALSLANEKGQAFKALSPEERKRMGITKAGQFLEQGDLVNLLLQRSGLTDEAAKDQEKTFPHQLRQIKATLSDSLADLGESALDSLTEKLGKGATAAERLQGYLKSEEGKKTIESIKDTVVKIVEGIAGIVQDLPKIGRWIADHKTLLETLAAAYVAAKAAPGFVGLSKGVGAVADAGVAKGVLGASGGAAIKAIPLIGAGLAADAALTTALRSKDLGMGITFGNVFDRDKDAIKERLSEFYQKKIAEMTKQPAAPDAHPALTGEGKAIELTVNHTTLLDGQVVAKSVEKHLVKGMKARTAGGAAPVSKD